MRKENKILAIDEISRRAFRVEIEADLARFNVQAVKVTALPVRAENESVAMPFDFRI